MIGPAACLFDLDGVIVDTAKYHFIAWRQVAEELGFAFTEKDNERLKGVSRQRSLEILLEVGGVVLDTAEKVRIAEKKNALYLRYVQKMKPDEVLPGAAAFVSACRRAGLRTALATASRNAKVILDLLLIAPLFDVVVDGTQVHRTKPDPEVFLLCAEQLGVDPWRCVVFEDAEAGIDAAHAAGMFSVGIGDASVLHRADIIAPGLAHLTVQAVLASFGQGKVSATR